MVYLFAFNFMLKNQSKSVKIMQILIIKKKFQHVVSFQFCSVQIVIFLCFYSVLQHDFKSIVSVAGDMLHCTAFACVRNFDMRDLNPGPLPPLLVIQTLSAGETGLSGVPIWIMVTAIVAGLLLVTIITLILWKFGFFERKRVSDVTQSVKVGKHSSPLLRGDEYIS